TRSYGDWSSDVCSSDLAVISISGSPAMAMISASIPGAMELMDGDPHFPGSTELRSRRSEFSITRIHFGTASLLSGTASMLFGTRSEEHTSELQSPYDLV